MYVKECVDIAAQYGKGLMYYNGEGINKEYSKASGAAGFCIEALPVRSIERRECQII